ncbi:MAG: hypothetical protein ABI678_10435, partial [Kofleriaceae bacterium]
MRTWVVAMLLLSGCLADVDGSSETDDIAAKAAPPAPPPNAGPNTVFTNGPPKAGNPFFASLGTNGRTCGTCHVGTEGWTITPAGLQARFDATNGTDPVFRTNDGSVSPNADVSTVAARRTAYAMLLSRGLIRIGIGIPATAEFTLDAVDDPYGYANTNELSLFRRPMPTTNLPFLTAIMWDGREPSLATQSIDATLGHAQATGTVQTDMDGIVAFEQTIFTAVKTDPVAGDLTAEHTTGGPKALSTTAFYIGINDPLGGNPQGTAFDPNAMQMYVPWTNRNGGNAKDQKKAQIARGEALFNTHPIAITNVKGLNDLLGAPVINGTCTTCHDTPSVGNHSVKLALDLGLTDADLRTPDMPLYTLRNKTTGATIQTTDPGRALISGKWADIGKFKGPVLRALAARAPYFHNGAAATLEEAVDFYEDRFAIGLTRAEKA